MIAACAVMHRFRCISLSLALLVGLGSSNLRADGPEHQDAVLPESYFPVHPSEEEGFIPPMTTFESIVNGFATYPERCFLTKGGAAFGERAMWSPKNVTLANPYEYRRITTLDNDDPSSLFYTQRPNFFNIAVEDEWDWNNLINTDRPDFTDTPFTVGEGNVLMETGITNTITRASDSHSQLRSLPETLFRVGVTNQFEMRYRWLGYQLLNSEDPSTGAKAQAFGAGDIDVGFKCVLFEQRNWFPLSTLVAGAILPTGTDGFSGNSVQPHFNFVQGWGIRRYLYLKHQFGLDHLTQPSFSVDQAGGGMGATLAATHPTVNSYHSSVSCLYQATKRIGGFVEWFALYGANQKAENFADTGIFFYFTPTIQFDCVLGTSVAAAETDTLFTKVGFSTRW